MPDDLELDIFWKLTRLGNFLEGSEFAVRHRCFVAFSLPSANRGDDFLLRQWTLFLATEQAMRSIEASDRRSKWDSIIVLV